MKPAQLIPPLFALTWLAFLPLARAQGAVSDTEPAAAAPAPPPTPAPADAPPPAPDLPPPPPPGGSPPPPPRGTLVISAPPTPPAMLRAGYKVHDGFYLRMAAGVGGGHMNVSSDNASASDFAVGGPGLSLNLWIGGTPWRGIALGGLFSAQTMAESDAEVNGRGTSQEMAGASVLLGPFIDAFPDPQRGLHVGGSLGLAGFSAKGSGSTLERAPYLVEDYRGSGFGASGWVGYMGFVGPEWSMGGMLQLTALSVRQSEDGIERKGSGYTLSLNFSALYH